MTLTRIARTARLAGLGLLAAAFAGGCKKPADKPGASTANGNDPAILALPGATTTPTAGPDPRSADAFARDFLKAVNDGTATPTQLTPRFKAMIAPPVFGSDTAQGFSSDGVVAWLALHKGKVSSPDLRPPTGVSFGESVGFYAVAPTTITLRVTKTGSPQVDWLFATPPAVALTGFNTQAYPAAVTAVAFFQILASAEDRTLADRLAASLLTPALRERLAPPFGSDKAGYNAGILAHKLNDLRGSATGFRITSLDTQKVIAVPTGVGTGKPITLSLIDGGLVSRPALIEDWKTD